jgi:hypothetical protein
MRRSRKPLSVVRRIEGSNPSPSASQAGLSGKAVKSGSCRGFMTAAASPLKSVGGQVGALVSMLTGEPLTNKFAAIRAQVAQRFKKHRDLPKFLPGEGPYHLRPPPAERRRATRSSPSSSARPPCHSAKNSRRIVVVASDDLSGHVTGRASAVAAVSRATALLASRPMCGCDEFPGLLGVPIQSHRIETVSGLLDE